MAAADLPLDGFVVGITADRRSEDQAELLRRRGASVLHGPVLRTLPLGDDAGLRQATESLIESPPQTFIANTGIGMRAWLTAAESWGLGDGVTDVLRHARVVARGPKAAGAVVTAGCTVEWQAPTGRLTEVVDYVRAAGGLGGSRVALQLDGSGCIDTADALRAAGAEVMTLSVYRWIEPDDFLPAQRLADAVCAGSVDAVTFTSAPAVHRFFDLAGDRDLVAAFAYDVLPVCIGPVCHEAAMARGLGRAVRPPRALLGAMINTLADALTAQRRVVRTIAGEMVMQGSAVVIDGTRVELSDRELGVLKALARRPGAVVPKSVLLREVWGDPDTDAHALEVTVGRLRRRLGDAGATVRTVVRRGYQLATD